MNKLNREILDEIDELQIRYVDALDNKSMEQWLHTFADDERASYICTTRENLIRKLPLAIMHDDCRARLCDRVTYVTKIWAGTFQDYGTRHMVQRLHVQPVDEREVAMRSSFVVLCTPEDSNVSEVLASGIYEDIVQIGCGQPRFVSRKAILDASVLPRYLVYPI
jgi:3-phenylpropionate/cinnamic acid dioxygenase small subunit